MIVTIDGPSGTGKSTVSKLLAKTLNFEHLDTGAFYRALAFHALSLGLKDLQESEIKELLASFQLEIFCVDQAIRYSVNKQDVTEFLRTPEVSDYSSKISVFPKVRKAVVALQREYAGNKNVVAEGRDLGSAVFPKAKIKFFLTADKEVRAKRRYHELISKQPQRASEAFYQETLEALIERDRRDAERKASPLVCPEGAIIIDTSEMTIDQVVETLQSIVAFEMQRKKKWKHVLKRGFYHLVFTLFKGIFSLFYRMKVYGQENLGAHGGVIAANHASFLDPPILAVASGIEVHFLARESLFKIPLLKNLIRWLNAHPLKGGIGDIGVIKLVRRLILMQQKIIMFPEGSRSSDGEIKHFKRGLANIVMRTGSTVYPAYIQGAYEIWGRNSRFPGLRGRINVAFGKPLPASRYALLDKKEAQEALSEDLQQAIIALKEWLENDRKDLMP